MILAVTCCMLCSTFPALGSLGILALWIQNCLDTQHVSVADTFSWHPIPGETPCAFHSFTSQEMLGWEAFPWLISGFAQGHCCVSQMVYRYIQITPFVSMWVGYLEFWWILFAFSEADQSVNPRIASTWLNQWLLKLCKPSSRVQHYSNGRCAEQIL